MRYTKKTPKNTKNTNLATQNCSILFRGNTEDEKTFGCHTSHNKFAPPRAARSDSGATHRCPQPAVWPLVRSGGNRRAAHAVGNAWGQGCTGRPSGGGPSLPRRVCQRGFRRPGEGGGQDGGGGGGWTPSEPCGKGGKTQNLTNSGGKRGSTWGGSPTPSRCSVEL